MNKAIAITLLLLAGFGCTADPMDPPVVFDRCVASCEMYATPSMSGPEALLCSPVYIHTNLDCETSCGAMLDKALKTGCFDLAEELVSCREQADAGSYCTDCAMVRQMLSECTGD